MSLNEQNASSTQASYPSKGVLDVVQLYPRDMNIYGDWGNTLALQRRAQRHGYEVRIHDYNPGDPWPSHADIFLGGGGQDSGQLRVAQDLASIAHRLRDAAQDGMPMLMICGLYQLFGNEFRTGEGAVIPGIGIFDMVTEAGPERLIGNIVTESARLGTVVGYENHSGLTRLASGQEPFARVVSGAGNNGEDDTEGAQTNEVIGSYLHGSLLPKNPAVTDHLIRAALARRGERFEPASLDDTYAREARAVAQQRPR